MDSERADLRDAAARRVRHKATARPGAILAALTLPHSQGQTEGQVNKLKLVKRAIYGRAKFDLLRQRILYTAKWRNTAILLGVLATLQLRRRATETG